MLIHTGGLANGSDSPAARHRRLDDARRSSRLAPAANAQSISGDLVVRVVDPSDLAVPGAAVTLTEVETGVMQSAVTDAQGTYLFGQLKPGVYKLEVTTSGFKSTNVQDIRIQVGQRARVDVKLVVATVAEDVTVSAAAATLINAESAAIGQVVDSKVMVELPLNGRNFIQLAQLSAGAMPIGIGVSPASSWTGRGDTTLSIAGGRESNNSFLVNGIETRNARFGNAGIRPSIDAIQEVKIQRSTFGAEFGRSAAIINTTIKSGTNQWHGSVFEFNRDDALRCERLLPEPHRPRQAAVQAEQLRRRRSAARWWSRRCTTAGIARSGSSTTRGSGRRCGRAPPGCTRRRRNSGAISRTTAPGPGLFPTSSAFCQANAGSRKCVDVIDYTTGQPFPGNVIPTARLDPDHAARHAVHGDAERDGAGRRRHVPELQLD